MTRSRRGRAVGSPPRDATGVEVRIRHESFPKHLRLLRRPDFRRVQGGGRRRVSPNLVMISRINESGGTRYGLVVSRKVGNAVVRNRVKRWLRESIRRQHHGLTGLDVVFIARSGAPSAGYATLYHEVGGHLGALRRSASETSAGTSASGQPDPGRHEDRRS